MKLTTAIGAFVVSASFAASAYAGCTNTDWGGCFWEWDPGPPAYDCELLSNRQQPECFCPANPDHIQCEDWWENQASIIDNEIFVRPISYRNANSPPVLVATLGKYQENDFY